MAILQTGAELVLENPGNEEALRLFAKTLFQNMQRLNKLVIAMRYPGDGIAADREWISVNQFLENISLLCQPACKARQISWIVKPLTGDLSFFANYAFLYQAIINLVTNALQFTPEGGWITLSAEQTGTAEAEELVLSVADTGVGVPKENLRKIFEPYFTTGKEKSNVGLGLPIVVKTVGEHGGELDVESEVGKGTVFRIKLPLATNRT
jgi:signal transduction histidine kinase